jgi:hypothetical protein
MPHPAKLPRTAQLQIQWDNPDGADGTTKQRSVEPLISRMTRI